MKFSDFWNLCYNSGLKTQKSVAHFLGVTEQSISLWKKNDHVPSIYESQIKKDESKEESKEIFFEKIIDNQLDQIDFLKEENERLKNQNNDSVIIQKMIDDEYLSYHYETEVQLRVKNFKLERMCKKVSNMEIQSEYLGYSPAEIAKYWDVGNWYLMHDHPIEKILTEKTKAQFYKVNKQLTGFFNLFKEIKSKSEVPMSFRISYKHKDKGEVTALVSSIFNPFKLSVISKVSFD